MSTRRVRQPTPQEVAVWYARTLDRIAMRHSGSVVLRADNDNQGRAA